MKVIRKAHTRKIKISKNSTSTRTVNVKRTIAKVGKRKSSSSSKKK